MKRATLLCLTLILGGCASYAPPDRYDWSIEVPESVDRAADFIIAVRTHLRLEEPLPEAEELSEEEVRGLLEDEGMEFQFTIVWPGGSTSPLPRVGWSGEEIKVRARALEGKATLLIHVPDEEENLVKVAEKTFEVK